MGCCQEGAHALDQLGRPAQIAVLLEEPPEDGDPEPLADTGQARKIGHRLIESMALVPTVGPGSGWTTR
jgi:hypothetical protein